MSIFDKKIPLIVFSISIGIYLTMISGCSGCCKITPDWHYEKTDVLGSGQSNISDKLDVDLYVDCTTSMQGYAFRPGTNYLKFLDELENSAESSWKKTNLNYYKFSAVPVQLTPTQYKLAGTASFYNGLVTNIDSVVAHSSLNRMGVIITDLFQSKSDIHSIIKQLKTNCFEKGIAIGLLSVKSEFSGKVYDAGAPFPYKSVDGDRKTFRPFYALMFGKASNIVQLFNNLKQKSSVSASPNSFVLISDSYVKDFQIDFVKPQDTKNISIKRKDLTKNLVVAKLNGDSSKLQIKYSFTQLDYSPLITVSKENTELFVQRESMPDGKNIKRETVNDISISKIAQESSNSYSIKTDIDNKEKKGCFSYECYLKILRSSRVNLPNWITENSSQVISSTANPNKTLNLEEFVTDLIKSSWVVFEPKLGKFYIELQK